MPKRYFLVAVETEVTSKELLPELRESLEKTFPKPQFPGDKPRGKAVVTVEPWSA